MARRLIQFLPGHYYHIFNRGDNREGIFPEKENYRFFLRRLHKYFDPAGVELIAYCLMPNHYHLLIQLSRQTNFSNVMRSFSVSYIKSYNLWHGRVGHVFQGDFKARQLRSSNGLAHLCRYIHLNPYKAGLVARPEDWEFSDYREWISPSADQALPGIRIRNKFFGSAEEYQKFVMDYAREEEVSVDAE